MVVVNSGKTQDAVESFYPLSPMQAGMLFHSLFDPGTGIYVEQSCVRLRGLLDVTAFEKSWQASIERHSILRTSFVWENVKEPIQVVHQKVKLPFTFEDWRDESAEDQKTKLESYLDTDRQKGFDLSKVPLMRFVLFQTGDDEYNFIWTHHHILLDGWSIPILLQEVIVRYHADRRSLPFQLPAVRPFRDYIVWLKRQDLGASEAFWRSKLSGFHAPTSLPVAGLGIGKKAGISEASASQFHGQEIFLDETLTRNLYGFARKNGLTVNTLIQGAWAILLSRYSGDVDILFGTTVSGRPAELPGSEWMLGLFINTLPVRVQVLGDAKLVEWLKELQTSQAELRQYDYTPLVQIQAWSEAPRGTPLFQTLLVYENIPLRSADGSEIGGDFVIESGQSESHTNFPITLVAAPGPELSLKITYDNQWFSASVVERMLEHLETIIEGMLASPDQTLAKVPLLTPAERQQILFQWNDTFAEIPGDLCAHQLFELQVQKTPQAIALIEMAPGKLAESASDDGHFIKGRSITFSELNLVANLLARRLIAMGLKREDLVGLYLERSIEMVAGLLAVLKAGGAYVPMDPAYPSGRLAYMVEDAGAKILLTQKHLMYSGKLSDSHLPPGLQLVELDVILPEIEAAFHNNQPGYSGSEIENLYDITEPENLAYVIYTSGSTGKPKGAMIEHRGLVNYLTWCQRAYPLQDGDGSPVHSSISFDLTITSLLSPLVAGKQVYLLPEGNAVETLTQFVKYYTAEDPSLSTPLSLIKITPAHLALLGEQLSPAQARNLTKAFIIGGENLLGEQIAFWQQNAPDTALVNEYGPTETVVGCCIFWAANNSTSDVVPIGRPIINTQLYILDRKLEPLPVGIPGELYIGGFGVGRGYLNRPELTTERFIDNPFRRGERLFKTGDLVRYLPGGDIEFLGRFDFQVKIRGYRVELGEIESVLSQHPQVSDVAVWFWDEARSDASESEKTSGKGKRIVAYMVPEYPDNLPKLDEIRKFCQNTLPEYMLPAAFIYLDEIPLTSNGKVDRPALVRLYPPAATLAENIKSYRPPRTEQEKILSEIWEGLLGIDEVGIQDNFFDLGGDSITSFQAISRAKKAGIEIKYRQLFEHPTIEELAEQASRSIGFPGDITAEQGLLIGPAPLSAVQHWFFEHHVVSPHHYNTSMMVEIRQQLNLDMIRSALKKILSHHDALRSKFVQSIDGWQLSIDPPSDELPFSSFDFSELSSKEQKKRLLEEAGNTQKGMNLAQPPLIRVVYFKLSNSNFDPTISDRLLLVFHHLVFDGVSARIIVEDFLTAMMQLSLGYSVNLPPKTTSYKYWSSKTNEIASDGSLDTSLEYWRRLSSSFMLNNSSLNHSSIDENLEGMRLKATLSNSRFPPDFPDGENTYGTADQITISINRFETIQLIRTMPRQLGVKVNAILLTAMARSMWVLPDQNKENPHSVLVELEGHGRDGITGTGLDDLDLSRTVGWFTSIYPFRLDLDPELPLNLQLAATQTQLEQIPQHGVSFGMLKYLHPDQTVRTQMAAIPQPEINFNYLGQFDQSGVDPLADLKQSQADKHDLTGRVSVESNTLAAPLIRIIEEPVGSEQNPASPRTARLYLVAIVSGEQLSLRWLYSRRQYKRETVQKMAKALLQELQVIIAEGIVVV